MKELLIAFQQVLNLASLTAEFGGKMLRAAGGAVASLALVGALIALSVFVFWVWILITAIRERYENKTIWIAILLVGGWVAAIVFYFGVYRALKKNTHDRV